MPDWIQHFNLLESTNNYAMQLIDAGMAQHGWVIWADYQSKGKGQRGNSWQDDLGNLKFSLIISPKYPLQQPFQLSMIVAVIVAKYLKVILSEFCSVTIKWPNDIYINDKKTCGILIENVFRGANWSYAIVGVGLNVNQKTFPDYLNHATSMSRETAGNKFDFMEIITDLRNGILNELKAEETRSEEGILEQYNNLLYLKGKSVHFMERASNRKFEAFVMDVEKGGKLVVLSPTGIEKFEFGSIEWLLGTQNVGHKE